MARRFILSTIFILVNQLYGQIPQLTGFIRDANSGESLHGAIISDSASFMYTYTNHDGYYCLGLTSGKHSISITASGYKKIAVSIDVYGNVNLSVNLKPLNPDENDTFSNYHHTLNDYRSGHTSPLATQINDMPALMHQQDPVKFLQYLPGVTGGIEGLAGMYVRGGNSDQNLVTMDGLPIFGNGHLFGFMSNFNPDLVRDVQFYRGVSPARYGGRAGATMDVSTKEGNSEYTTGNFIADPLTLKFNINGPVNNSGSTTFSLGMRRTWIDLFLPRGGDEFLSYNLHDYNAKLVFRPTKESKLSLWVYNGRDKFASRFKEKDTDSLNRSTEFSTALQVKWQNTLAGINYSRKYNNRLYGSYILGMSRYRYKFPFEISASIMTDTSVNSFNLEYDQDISLTDIIAKANYEYSYNSNNQFRYGVELINHNITPSVEIIKLSRNASTGLDSTFGLVNKQAAFENSIYTEWECNLGVGLKVNIGARLWSFITREAGYLRPEPRIFISQLLEGNKSLKFGFSMANQGLNQLSSVNGNLPNDIWFPVSRAFKPQRNTQITAGYYLPLKRGIEFGADVYYKWMSGITDLKNIRPDELTENYWENFLAQGKGTAYGIEFLTMKKTGKLTGLVSYTRSLSNRTIPEINFGNTFPFRWDRRHKGVIQGAVQVSDEIKITFALVLMTGNAVSVPTGKYTTADGSFVYDYSEKNNFRMPFYKRLDVGFVKEINPDFSSTDRQFWGINFYNLLNFMNPVQLSLDNKQLGQNKVTAISYFPFLPSIFYKWEF